MSTPGAADTSAGTSDDAAKDTVAPAMKVSGRMKLILLIVVIAVVVAAAIWFIHRQTRGKYFQQTNDAMIEADATAVSARVNGYVVAVLVAENQDVTAGQPLMVIDSRGYQAQADQAKGQIAQAEAGIDSARASIGEQQATIAQSRAQLAAARAKAASDAAEVLRYAPLAASGAETREKLAQLKIAAAQSAADTRAQAAALLTQQRKIATFEAQGRQAQAQVQQAQAQLAAAEVDVGATIIRAAVAGRIGDKTVRVGQYAQAGTRLMSIVPLQQLYVTANFKETQLALMRVGQPVTIKVDALDGIELRGRIASLSPGTGAQFSLLPPQNATGNFTKIVQRVPVRIALEATPDARKLLVPGLSVTATVDTLSAKGELDKVKAQQEKLADQAR